MTGIANHIAFIFDLDGVLVDTARYHFLAWQRLAQELGIPFTEKDNERLKGVSRMQSLQIILDLGNRQLSQAEKETLAARKNAWYVDYISRLTPRDVLPGVVNFLTSACAKGIRLAVGSASKNANTILERLAIKNYFAAIITGLETTRAKPDPEVFELAAARLQVATGRCVVFEDAAAGIEAAHRAGMFAVGIGRAENLSQADLLADGLHDLTVEQVLAAFEKRFLTEKNIKDEGLHS